MGALFIMAKASSDANITLIEIGKDTKFFQMKVYP